MQAIALHAAVDNLCPWATIPSGRRYCPNGRASATALGQSPEWVSVTLAGACTWDITAPTVGWPRSATPVGCLAMGGHPCRWPTYRWPPPLQGSLLVDVVFAVRTCRIALHDSISSHAV
ncbi:hypothetical protein BHE74_00049824 [Ensete ventricosum]|nr:hypothetical protein BHE74_00049824 [Ensete ventricosum]RZS27791.1 hypothetical protein BHM03_00061318 [Ensete ventricosum]